jgi:DNA-binding GntR family transcriptional regulator
VVLGTHRRPPARPGPEHRQLSELVLAGDANQAIEVLTEHIDRAPSLLIAYAREPAWTT